MQAISRAWGIDPPLPGLVLRHALPPPNHTAVLHWGFTEKSWDAQWLKATRGEHSLQSFQVL